MAQLSSSQHRTLTALAETVLPAGKYLPAGGEKTPARIASFLDDMPDALAMGAGGVLAALDAASFVRNAKRFASLSPHKRLALVEGWRTGDPIRRLMLRSLVAPLKMAHFDDPALYQKLGCVYETAKVKGEAKPAYLRDRVGRLRLVFIANSILEIPSHPRGGSSMMSVRFFYVTINRIT